METDTPIDYLRGHPPAVRFVIEHVDRITLSAKSVAELYASVRGTAEDAERQDLEDFLAPFPVVPISADIARIGGQHTKSTDDPTGLVWRAL